MLVTIGTNRLRQTDGVIHICGKRQIALEWGPARGMLLLTMDLYGTERRHVARLRRNEWTFNDLDRFVLAHGPRGFTLTDSQSDHIVLHARVAGEDAVVITEGTFHSATGDEIEIVKHTARELAETA